MPNTMETPATNYDHLSPTEAVQLQNRLREQIRLVPLEKPITTIGGADISFNKDSDIVYAGIVVLSYPDLIVQHYASVVTTTHFPYIPGLLGFREVPALLEVWNKLETKPDVLVLDGHGIAHPRRMGIASHFGVEAGVPTIGCAKSLLTGSYGPLPDVAFSTVPLLRHDEHIGDVLRTKPNCNPVYISPGHLITQTESTEIIKNCVWKYRIPEPTRHAHMLVNRVRLSYPNKGEG